MITIYALTCPETGTPRYIGKTKLSIAVRLAGHICKAKGRHTNNYCSNWIRSLLAKGLQPGIIVVSQLLDDGDWQQAEMDAIAAYRNDGYALTNATAGGDGFHDMDPACISKSVATRRITLSDPVRRAEIMRGSIEARQAPEVRLKQSRSLKARYADPVKRAKLTDWMKTPDGRAAKSAASVKRHEDPEFAARHSATMKELWNRPERKLEARARSLKAWADPEITEKRLKAVREAHEKPELKQQMREMGREIGSRPEVKAKRSAKAIANWADPERSRKRRAALSSDESRAKMAASAKARWLDPEKSASIRKAFVDPESRQRRAEAAQRRNTPEYREMMRARTKAAWEKRRQK